MTGQPPPSKDRGWREDPFATREVLGHFGFLWVIAIIAVLATMLLPVLSNLKGLSVNRVVVYCAQDQVYAEPIFREFTRQTGVKVRGRHSKNTRHGAACKSIRPPIS